MGVPYLSKHVVKEALMDALGAPSTVEQSRELGRAAVFAVLRAAQGCQGAVIDSTWYSYSEPLVRELPGPVVEVRCRVPLRVVRSGIATESGTSGTWTNSAPRRSCGAAKWLH
jgi:hypothetical protein